MVPHRFASSARLLQERISRGIDVMAVEVGHLQRRWLKNRLLSHKRGTGMCFLLYEEAIARKQ